MTQMPAASGWQSSQAQQSPLSANSQASSASQPDASFYAYSVQTLLNSGGMNPAPETEANIALLMKAAQDKGVVKETVALIPAQMRPIIVNILRNV